MSNCGKYVDRNPTLRAAGICTKISEIAEDAFKRYSIDEAAENIMHTKCLQKYNAMRGDLLPNQRCIPEENLKELLSPELQKSRFVVFREKFAENMYSKKAELGKALQVDSKPEYITNESTTFGEPTQRSEPLYNLMFPCKSPDEVNRDYVRWHEKYIISHGHYLPSEQIRRHYTKPFDRHNNFGQVYDIDFNGKYVKKAMEQCNNLIVISKAQKQYLERTLGHLGRSVNRENHITPNMTFGAPSKPDECNVKALIEIQDQCEGTSPLITAIGNLNKIRQNLFDRHNLHMQDLKLALEKSDIKKTGLLSWNQIYEILYREGVHLSPPKITPALRHFKLIENEGLPSECIKYEELWKLLHVQYPIPKTGNISKMPPNIYNKDTTYRLMCQDRTKPPPVEALPLKAFDPEFAGEPTTVKDVISPDIPMHFGLTPSDFAKLRPKEELRRIFKRLINADEFDPLWEMAYNNLKRTNELISVDEIRNVMESKKTLTV